MSDLSSSRCRFCEGTIEIPNQTCVPSFAMQYVTPVDLFGFAESSESFIARSWLKATSVSSKDTPWVLLSSSNSPAALWRGLKQSINWLWLNWWRWCGTLHALRRRYPWRTRRRCFLRPYRKKNPLTLPATISNFLTGVELYDCDQDSTSL